MYQALKVLGYLILVLMGASVVYAGYVGVTYFPGIGV